MYIIGLFLITLGFLLDEGTTILVCLRGLCSLETNPIALRFGFISYLGAVLIFYSLLIFGWRYFNLYYKKAYKEKLMGYKYYDIFIFCFCVLIIFMTITKIEFGINNINYLATSYNDPGWIDYQLEQLDILKDKGDDIFLQTRQDDYFNNLLYVNYYKMLFILLLSYIFFRLDFRVTPYEYM